MLSQNENNLAPLLFSGEKIIVSELSEEFVDKRFCTRFCHIMYQPNSIVMFGRLAIL